MISQPTALNKDSILRHSILPGTGSVNMEAKVFRWVRFMNNMISLFATMSRKGLKTEHPTSADTPHQITTPDGEIELVE